jgi:quinol monooxygenase YgiN
MKVALAVRVVARPGEEGHVLDYLERLTVASRAEVGCEQYDPHRDPDDPRAFFLYERYVDRAALEAHWASDHFRELAVEGFIPLLESRERALYEPVL